MPELKSSEKENQIDAYLNADEIPFWLTESFLKNILKIYFNEDKLIVSEFKVQQCGGKGDSYVSKMYRVGINFNDGKSLEVLKFISFIIKTPPSAELATNMLGPENYDVQAKEMEMYGENFPKFKKILSAVIEDISLFPNMFFVDRALDLIVLEDLAKKNFIMADRLKGLDNQHIQMTLRKLAQYHAASAMVLANDPNAFLHQNAGMYTRRSDSFHPIFKSLYDCFSAEVSTWKGFEYYSKKLSKVRETFMETSLKAFDRDDNDFNVLIHGDLWTNNIMFKYDEAENPIDASLIDFQFVCYGSPALDLIYFLYTSTTDELRHENFEESVQFYFYELQNMLKKLGYDMEKFPTLHAFQMQVMKKYFYGR
jgi:hypothetical protein